MRTAKRITIIHHDAKDNVSYRVGECGVTKVYDRTVEFSDSIVRLYEIGFEDGKEISIENCSVEVEY